MGLSPTFEAEVRCWVNERRTHPGAGHDSCWQDAYSPKYITQDIHRVEHEVVIVFDPKGDADLLKRMYVEAS